MGNVKKQPIKPGKRGRPKKQFPEGYVAPVKEKKVREDKYKPMSVEMQTKVVDMVTSLYLKGNSYRWIANKIKDELNQTISFVMVGNYVNKMLEEWKQERVKKVDDMKTIELSRIANLENTYWEGWNRSLMATKRSTDKQRAQPGKTLRNGELVDTMQVKQAEKTDYVEENFGDPRFLDGIKWCIQMRCKILGVEAPIEFKGSITSTVKRTTVFKTRTRNRPE